MGIAIRITLFFAILYVCACLSNASEDVELKDPHLVVIATFAANTILKDADDFGIQNTSSLHRIMDAHIVPSQQPIVSLKTIFESLKFNKIILSLTSILCVVLAYSIYAYSRTRQQLH